MTGRKKQRALHGELITTAVGPSSREVKARDCYFWLANELVPNDKIQKLVADAARRNRGDSRRKPSFDDTPLMQAINMSMAKYRIEAQARSAGLLDWEIVEQAKQISTAAILLKQRLCSIHPNLEANLHKLVNDREPGLHWHDVTRRLIPDLDLIHELAISAGTATVPIVSAVRKGPIPDHARAQAYRTVYTAVLDHFKPRLRVVPARALAADLMRAAGLPLPNNDKQLRTLLAYKPGRVVLEIDATMP